MWGYLILLMIVPVVLMLLLMPKLLPRLRAMKLGQTIYELGPKHQQKQGTPNMGGILIGGITAAGPSTLAKWRACRCVSAGLIL